MKLSWILYVGIALVVVASVLVSLPGAHAAPAVAAGPGPSGPSLGVLAGAAVPSGAAPVSAAYDTQAGELYVSTQGPWVSILKGNTVVANVSITGLGVGQSVFDPAYGLVYAPVQSVSNSPPMNGIAVLNGTRLATTVPIHDFPDVPEYAVYDAADGYVYVGDQGGNVYVLNATGVVAHLSIGVVIQLAYDPVTGDVYAAADQNVTVIHGTSVTAVVGAEGGGYVVAVTVDPANGYVYASETGLGSILVIDGTLPLADVFAPSQSTTPIVNPGQGTFDTANGDVYFLDYANTPSGPNTGAYLDVLSGSSYVGVVPTGPYPVGITYDPKLGEVFARGLGISPNWNGTLTAVKGMAVNATVSIGYVPYEMAYDPGTGNLTVGSSTNVTVVGMGNFTNTTIVQAGLPSGTQWVAASDAVRLNSTGASAPFRETHGIHTYSVGKVAGYLLVRPSGRFDVGAAKVTIRVVYVPLYNVTVSESGLPLGTLWSVRIGTETLWTTGTSVTFLERTGEHYVVVPAIAGYRAVPAVSLIIVHSGPVSKAVAFRVT